MRLKIFLKKLKKVLTIKMYSGIIKNVKRGRDELLPEGCATSWVVSFDKALCWSDKTRHCPRK